MKISHFGRYEQRDNTTRNTLIGAGVAATGGAYVGHVIATPLKDGKFNDKFVHNVMTACADEMDDVKFIDFARKVNDMPAHPTPEDVKFVEGYLSENAKPLGLLDDTSGKPAKFSISEYIDNVKQGYKEAVADTTEALGKIFKKGKLVKPAESADDNLKIFADITKDVVSDIKVQNARKYALVGLITGGVVAWVSSKLANKM